MGEIEGTPNQVPMPIGVTATLEEQRDQRQWYLHRCVEALQEANKIRADDALMKELREYLRQKRDDLALLLDNIG